MQIELKQNLLRFLQKIINSVPGVHSKEITAEAFELEMNLRMSRRNLNLRIPKEMYELLSGLTEYQREHYETISWLTDPMGPRAMGKTHLMAISFIQHSLFFGTWVTIYNHNNSPDAIREMVDRIQKIVSEMDDLRLSVRGMGPSRSMHNKPSILVARIPSEKLMYKGEWKNERKDK